ncbi:hypothetical protein [Bacillus amyloliquefaciens]|uniref:hypothetical protein n=1 Tax=Bacillus amyloliquefaciens TaxID=1390 RepID=UPI000E23CFBE|nr:hypothetical protein [Bacillus amyloliquefaciens]RDY88647.1 hypothetical protein C3733_07940 [Bacillus amyloliquefaciens]
MELLQPNQYFEMIKSKKNKVTDKELQRYYDNCLVLLNKYKQTNQIKAAKKLIFHLESIEKEREIVKLGIDTFVYRDDIEEYIDNIAKDTVKIIELENYEREIPDEVIIKFNKVKDKLDRFYVVFTDYTGKVARQIEKERRDKDPILFGTFQDESSGTLIERFYFIGDWEDEYCDLTLDKMISEVQEAKESNIAMTINTPQDIEQLKIQLNNMDKIANGFRMNNLGFAVVNGKENWFKKLFKRTK